MPGIHVLADPARKTWMAGTRPGHDEKANYLLDNLRSMRSWFSSREQTLLVRIEFNSLVAGGGFMGRYLLLWLIGVPLPILVLIYAFGGLH
jgi:hypothetical protein